MGTYYIVSSGVTSSGITLRAGDGMAVIFGGVADRTVVSGDAELSVYSGGVASDTVVSGNLNGSGGVEYVVSGGVAIGTVLTGSLYGTDAAELVFFGGVASGTVINTRGYQDVEGVAIGTMLHDYGEEIVESGGVTSGTVIGGGSELVSAGGVASGTMLGGGYLVVEGVAFGTVVSNGGLVEVHPGGVASGIVVGSGGTEAVDGGGIASGAVVSSGGRLGVGLGADASGAVVSSGGAVGLPLTSAYGQWSIFGANVIYGVTIESGAATSLNIYQGGSIADFVVLRGQNEYVYSGGAVSGTVVSSGGRERISSGAVASGTVVSSGGNQDVYGGVVSGTEVNGGYEYVERGVTSGAVVNSGGYEDLKAYSVARGTVVNGGYQYVAGESAAIGTVISGGGIEEIVYGGIAHGTTISSGGAEIVHLDGMTSDTLIAGGTLTLSYRGVIGGTTTFSGTNGDLIVDQTLPGNAVGPIGGFLSNGNMVDFRQLTFSGNASVDFNSSTDVLTVTEGAVSASLQLVSGDYTDIAWGASDDGSGGTDIIACYRRGTKILTPKGERAVETLKIGDRVVTFAGKRRRVKWIGRRAYHGRFIAGNKAVLPIRIAKDALAHGIPRRDLYLSPEHALYIRDVLVPAMYLVNGMTIVQEKAVEEVEYFHIELDSHDVIIANGAPAETYVDCDNRAMFQNAGEYAALYPEGADRPRWQFCAERLVREAEELTRIRAALSARAGGLGYRLDRDPDLHLAVDGECIRPEKVSPGLYRFTIPAGSEMIRLASRSAVRAEVDVISEDNRRLGVPLVHLTLRSKDLCLEAGPGCAFLRDGFHEDEGGHRWTDGMARLPAELLRPFVGATTLDVRLAPSDLRYPVATLAPSPSRGRKSKVGLDPPALAIAGMSSPKERASVTR